MGYDFYIRERERAVADGHDLHFRLNVAAMSLVRDVLDERDALDWATGPIRLPARHDYDEDPYERLQLLWQAEQDVRAGTKSPDELKVPGVKFTSNEDWLVNGNECRALSLALSKVTVEECQRAIENDESAMQDLKAWAEVPEMAEIMERLGEGREPPSVPEYARQVLETVHAFRDYCDRAAQYGGFRVR